MSSLSSLLLNVSKFTIKIIKMKLTVISKETQKKYLEIILYYPHELSTIIDELRHYYNYQVDFIIED